MAQGGDRPEPAGSPGAGALRLLAGTPGVAERSAFYVQLGTMYEAGVPLERALRVSGGSGRAPLAAPAGTVAEAVAAGHDLVAAGERAGLFGPRDASILRAASAGGRLGPMLLRLGEWYRLQAEHAGTVKRQLALPAFVVGVVIFLGPLPALVLGRLDFAGYLQRTVLPLALVLGLARLLGVATRRRRAGRANVRGLDRLLLGLPAVGPHLARREVARWLASMALLLEAGVLVGDAAGLARDTIALAPVRRDFERTARQLPQGASLEVALAGNRWIEPDTRYLLASGEHSGRLPEMLWRAASAQQSRVEAFERACATWAPRVLYFLVLLWLAWGLAGTARSNEPFM